MPSRAVVITSRLRVPASALHLAGFRRWAQSRTFPRRGKVSFVDGEVHLDTSPEEIRSHNSVKGDVFGALWSHARINNLGVAFADRALLINEDAGLATEPDVMFCRWETLESGRVKLVESAPGSGRQVEVQGTPDIVVEIVSKSSVKKDRERLREAYYRAGIPEYWLIDARGDEIEFLLLIRGESEYTTAPHDAEGYCPSAALHQRVRLTRELNRIGGWRYTLHLA